MRKPLLMLLVVTVSLQAAHAGLRNSMNYAITTDTVDLGGVLATSASVTYTNVGGVETIAGTSSVVSPAEIGRDGYVGQLNEVVSLAVTSAASSIPQGTNTQLSGTATLDDGTTSALPGASITWGAVAYPFMNPINAMGQLAAATNVYAAPSGTVTGSYLGASGSTTVTVTGPYASSIIPDSWYLQYFGTPTPPNPLAAPTADADGTGQSNLFKYLAGLNPTDGSRFVLTIAAVPGQSGEKTLMYTPVYSGRTYTPQYSASLTAPSWQTLTNISTSDNGTTRTVTDLSAGSAPRFYRVQISMP
jgi:hypothetical protein